MNRLLRAAIAFVCLVGFGFEAHGQTTTITASHERMGGFDITTGFVTFTPVNVLGSPIAFADATGAQNGPTAFQCAIAAGAITGIVQNNGSVSGTCSVPDASLTNPVNIRYAIQVFDTSVGLRTSGQTFTLQSVTGVSGTSWALDHYGPPANTSNVQTAQFMQGPTTPSTCLPPYIFTNTVTNVSSTCIGGVYVSLGIQPASVILTSISGMAGTNLVAAGDSRIAELSGSAGSSLMDFIAARPQFKGASGVYDGAVGGSTCETMTSVYSTNVQPYKPNGTTVIRSLLFILTGHNNYTAATPDILGVWSACMHAYITQAVADGFTPILLESYYSAVLATNQSEEKLRESYNNYLWQLSISEGYFYFDFDRRFPPATSQPGYYLSSNTHSITGYAITGSTAATQGTIVFNVSGTGGFAVGSPVAIYGMPSTSACINNRRITATAVTSSTVTALVSCPNVTSTDTGIIQDVVSDPTHMGLEYRARAAQAIANAYALGGTGDSDSSTGIQTQFQTNGTDPIVLNGPLSVPNPITGMSCLDANDTTDFYSIHACTYGLFPPTLSLSSPLTLTIANGGTGWAVGNTFTIAGGSTLATGTVSAVTGGVATSATISGTLGAGYSVSSGLATTATTGTGTSLTVNITAISGILTFPAQQNGGGWFDATYTNGAVIREYVAPATSAIAQTRSLATQIMSASDSYIKSPTTVGFHVNCSAAAGAVPSGSYCWGVDWGGNLLLRLGDKDGRVHSPIVTITAAATITPTATFLNVTSSGIPITTIATDTLDTAALGSCYYLNPLTGGFTWATGGNILNSGTAAVGTFYQACWFGTGFIIK